MKTLVAFVLASSCLFGDELVMEDGKTLEWKCLVDKGDSYEVTPLRGEKKIVKKSEVKEIRIKRLDSNLLTGATFTTDDGKFTVEKASGKPIDVLSTVDPKKCVVPGNNGKATADFKDGKSLELNFVPDRFARIDIQVPFPAEYDLSMTVEYLSGNTPVFIGFVNSMAKWVFCMDSQGSALMNVDKKPIESQKGSLAFGMGRVEVIVYVRSNGLIVSVGGKEAVSFTGDWKRLVGSPECIPKKGTLAILMSETKLMVHSMTLTPVVPKK